MASCYRQLSAKKIKTGFVGPCGPKAQDNKTVIDSISFILLFLGSCLKCDTIYDFSVWLQTGLNPANIKRIFAQTKKKFTLSKIEDLKYLFLNGVPSLPL